MGEIQRVRVPWTGGIGGAGVSTFYFTDAATGLPPLRAFFEGIKQGVPTGIQWQFDGQGDTIEATTGLIVGAWSTQTQSNVNATGLGNYAGPAGAMVTWGTGSLYFGHRVRGRTFIVPLTAEMEGVDGTLSQVYLNELVLQASTLVTASPGNLLVWSRPRLSSPAWTDVHGKTHPAKAARAGASFTVNGASVRDKVMVLRSRRD